MRQIQHPGPATASRVDVVPVALRHLDLVLQPGQNLLDALVSALPAGTNSAVLTLAGGDTTVTIKAAAQQTSGVNAAMAYGTDGAIAALGLVVLDDPKGIQPIYAPAPVVRAATLAQYPKIRTVLEPVFKTLDGPTLQGLNAKIAVEGQDAKKVSADYLKAKGFIK